MVDDFIRYDLLDKYGYRRFGLVELWSRTDIARVLASFEMQTKGLCGIHDEEQQKVDCLMIIWRMFQAL